MPKQFVTVAHSDLNRVGFRALTYDHNKIVQEPVPAGYRGEMAIVECGDSYRAQYQADRYSSGLIGAKVHNSLEAAEAYIEEHKE